VAERAPAAAPIIASLAAELGALTVAVVTKPFNFEGKRRRVQAEQGIRALRDTVDTLITIPNERLLKLRRAGHLAGRGLQDRRRHPAPGRAGHLRPHHRPREINLDFADVKTIMHGMGMALMGTGVSTGEHRGCRGGGQRAISSPLLGRGVDSKARGRAESTSTGGSDMTLFEVHEAASIIQEAADEEANIIFGTASIKDEGRW